MITWLDQQLENQRFRAGGLKAMAFALPAEARAMLTETAEMLLAEVDAKRRILDDWQQELDRRNAIYAQPDAVLHARRLHPDYEYATTEGPRKAWAHSDVPPDGDGWVRNTGVDDEGWERFEYTEESYWRRLRSEGERSRKPPLPPRHILLLALPHASHPDYRNEWRPA
jgi:hypothetical protein